MATRETSVYRAGCQYDEQKIILYMHPANESWRYTVVPSLIDWAHTQNDPRILQNFMEVSQWSFQWRYMNIMQSQITGGGRWSCEDSCGGHHRLRGKTTTGSTLDGAVFDTAQIQAYLVHNMSRSQLYLGFGHFGWLPSFFGQ